MERFSYCPGALLGGCRSKRSCRTRNQDETAGLAARSQSADVGFPVPEVAPGNRTSRYLPDCKRYGRAPPGGTALGSASLSTVSLWLRSQPDRPELSPRTASGAAAPDSGRRAAWVAPLPACLAPSVWPLYPGRRTRPTRNRSSLHGFGRERASIARCSLPFP